MRRAEGRAISIKENGIDWFTRYEEWTEDESHHILLESGRGGRYSIMGLSPWAVLRGKEEKLSIENLREQTKTEKKGPLLDSLRKWMSVYRTETNRMLPDFQGGIIGQFSYDLIRQIEQIPNKADDDLKTNDLLFLAFDEIYIVDHREDKLWIIGIFEQDAKEERIVDRLDKMEKRYLSPRQWNLKEKKKNVPVKRMDEEKADEAKGKRTFSKEEFEIAVLKVQEYIRSGDVFQVNLSVRESRKLRSEPFHIYKELRSLNPSPFMGYFRTPDVHYVGASPELLVEVIDEFVQTRPIAGTRSRGKNEEEDEKLARSLIDNEKERAEHIMLVDLERNDLGRVSEYGSVEVDELMVIEKYSHVMHIVSNVRGKKLSNVDAYDVIAATFPGGTITGAPKIRTMEIIEELESVRRGAYTGSMGWIGFDGNMVLNISIRTLIAKDGSAHVQAGAGIVIDSDPHAEYKESLKKAKALWRAFVQSEEEIREMMR